MTINTYKCDKCGYETPLEGPPNVIDGVACNQCSGHLCKIPDQEITKQEHYTQHRIQPMKYIGLNKIGFLEGNIIKYVSRYNIKNGVEDLKKAKHYLEKLIEREEKGTITL